MKVFCINGSADDKSSNMRLLRGLPAIIQNHDFEFAEGLTNFPIFTPTRGKNPPELVFTFKEQIKNADLIVISTPEYIHNMPAVLKNALEWITASGELNEKKVLAITYTPSPPRGEQAMQSLLWSLEALNAKIIAQLDLYQSDFKISEDGKWTDDATIVAIKGAFELAN